jgi:hypothetical protein
MTPSRLFPDVSEERNDWIDDEEPMSLEEASKSADAAIASTPPDHPDHEALTQTKQ